MLLIFGCWYKLIAPAAKSTATAATAPQHQICAATTASTAPATLAVAAVIQMQQTAASVTAATAAVATAGQHTDGHR